MKKITTRLPKSPEDESEFSPDHFVRKTRLVRAAFVHRLHNPKSSHIGSLDSVAPGAVAKRPKRKATITAMEEKPKLLRLSDAQ